MRLLAVLTVIALFGSTVVAEAQSADVGPLPERVRNIIAGLQKAGLAPKVGRDLRYHGGYHLLSDFGKYKPSGKSAQLSVSVGPGQKFGPPGPRGLPPFSPAPRWVGYSLTQIHTGEAQSQLEDYVYGYVEVQAMNANHDASLELHIAHYDTRALGLEPGAEREREEKSRGDALSAGLLAEAQNWAKVVAAIIDRADVGSSTATRTSPFELTALRQTFAAGKRRTLVVPRIEAWAKEQAAWAANNPRKALGSVMIAGGCVMAVAGIVASAPVTVVVGVVTAVGGIGAYQSTKPKEPPPEPAVVTEYREKLHDYQVQWKRGFTDAELNDLGIFMDDLGKLSPQQRTQVYKDADVEMTTLIESFKGMREIEERERSGK